MIVDACISIVHTIKYEYKICLFLSVIIFRTSIYIYLYFYWQLTILFTIIFREQGNLWIYLLYLFYIFLNAFYLRVYCSFHDFILKIKIIMHYTYSICSFSFCKLSLFFFSSLENPILTVTFIKICICGINSSFILLAKMWVESIKNKRKLLKKNFFKNNNLVVYMCPIFK